MTAFSYETARFQDPELPVIFHLDTVLSGKEIDIHWQDSLELLYFIQGEADVISNTLRQPLQAGEIAVINSNHLHGVRAITPVCRYYCFLIDRGLCRQLGASIEEVRFRMKVSDAAARAYADRIVEELLTQKPYYKAAVKADLGGLMVHLCRYWLEAQELDSVRQDKRLNMVKTAIRYIQAHFTESLSVEQISAAAGFSKYYFCRGFKEITGRTVVDYLNYTRCGYAQQLLVSGQYNVSESAERSGFSNLSYFTKTYKKYMGELPSQVGES